MPMLLVHRFLPVILLVIVNSAVFAHHSTVIFDVDRDIRIEGEVVKLRWANPHVYIQIREYSGSDEERIWNIEGQTPSGMSRHGWTSESLRPGDRVTVVANPPRDVNRRVALGHTVLKEDGTSLFIPHAIRRRDDSMSEQTTQYAATSLEGHWITKWNPDTAMGFLRARDLWRLTEKGLVAMENYDNSQNPGNECVPEPVPFVMIWPNGKFIELGDTEVVIHDELGPERRIDMESDDHSGAEESESGHSIGRWEDGVLLVDTTRFTPHRRGLAVGGLPSGREKHLLERFRLSEDKSSIHYEFHLEDPEYLAASVAGKLELEFRPDLPFINEPCDLENARIYLNE
jgi:hypothetical protein